MTTIPMEEYELMKDSKYLMYVAAVDKALKSFEYTSEWADLISALGKLNKVLLGYTKFPVIPRRIKISKRLAQCMHPALPSGVHLKALETYDIIFKSMGTNRLSNELFIYSAGLFPLLGHAAMNIRPALLLVYETHFVPLEERLRPALSGFLSGVLPGLEIGSDHFDRTNTLLENVCKGVGPDWFYTCVWQCVRTNSPVRLPAISYILAHYSRKVSMEDQLYLIGNDIDVMVSGLCAAVQDSSVLVQRSALDLLLVCFPMQNTQLLYGDMVRLVTAALTTILRRDMSLNRRLYSWLLNSDVSPPATSEPHTEPSLSTPPSFTIPPTAHNNMHSPNIAFDLLTEAIRITLKQSSTTNTSSSADSATTTSTASLTSATSLTAPTIDVKPYRLLTSLFEKPQIGPLILDVILYDVFRALYHTCLAQQRRQVGAGGGGGDPASTQRRISGGRSVSFNGDTVTLREVAGGRSGGSNSVIVPLLRKEFVSQHCQELVKNANLLFNTLQSYYIWSYAAKLYERSAQKGSSRRSTCGMDDMHINEIGSGAPGMLEICLLTDFLLDIIPLETFVENTIDILPNLFTKIIHALRTNINHLNQYEITHSLTLCMKIVQKIQPAVVNKQQVQIPLRGGATNTADLLDTSTDDSLQNTSQKQQSQEKTFPEIKTNLEKSKSDSKLNDKLSKNQNELTIDISRERSNSNQMLLKKKEKNSPKIEKKKNKKPKSNPKLNESRKEEELALELMDNLEREPVFVKETVVTSFTQPVSNLKMENKQIKPCLELYEQFFVVFIETKIIPEVNVERVFKNFVRDKEVSTKHLEHLLSKCLGNVQSPEHTTKQDSPNNHVTFEYNETNSSDYDRAMKIATSLLVEFAVFPCVLEDKGGSKMLVGGSLKVVEMLPYWLKVLVVCACTARSGNECQIIAMNTLMEIFSLAKSQLSNRRKCAENCNSVVVMGILENRHIDFIEESTVVLEVMCRYLWELVGTLSNQNEIMLCVSLLYSVHNTFDSKVVEQVIGQYLVDEHLTTEFFKRFYLLWHLGRDLNITFTTNLHIKNFDRSLLKILDNLQNPDRTNIRLLSETFLTHSLLRNDLPRIIHPLLQKLLAPSTARISIRHVHIQDSGDSLTTGGATTATSATTNGLMQQELNQLLQQTEEARAAKQIYAISNVNGNVMYHVTSNRGSKDSGEMKQEEQSSPKPPQKKRWFILSKAGKKYTQVVNITTSLTENLNMVAKKNKDFQSVELPTPGNTLLETGAKSMVKLFINPLSSTKEVYPDGVDGFYTKIDPHISPTGSNNDSDSCSSSIEESSEISLRNRPSSKFNILDAPVANGIKEKSTPRLEKSQSFDEKRAKANQERTLLRSWSYGQSEFAENLNNDLEISTSAEEFFSDNNHEHVVTEVLNEIIHRVCDSKSSEDEEESINNLETELNTNLNSKQQVLLDFQSTKATENQYNVKNFTLFPMHYHLCLYYEVFDSSQILYTLKTLKSCLISNPHLFIRCLATSGLKDTKSNEILNLLARHRKSLLGSGFGGDVGPDYHTFYRNYMFLDVILLVCLNYARSFYPKLDDVRLTRDEIGNNRQIQLASLEILDVIVRYLVGIVRENSSKGFGGYIADMLVKCKLQKVLLHCLLTAVRSFDEEMTFAEEVLLYNGFQLYGEGKRVSEYVEAYQIQLLRLIHSVIILEYHVFPTTAEATPNGESPNPASSGPGEHLSYAPTILIPRQEMFLSAIVSALRHQNMKNLHENWCNMVTSCLPYFQDHLKQICLRTIFHICANVEKLSETYHADLISGELSADYATTQLESLTILVHYCLLDSTQTANPNLPFNSAPLTTNSNEIFNNLVNAFFSPIGGSGDLNLSNKQNNDSYQKARKAILSHMPRIISSVAKLWQTVVGIEVDYHSIYGSCRVVKQQLLEFLSPIAVHHGSSFLAAIAVAWNDRRNPFTNVKSILPEPNDSQNNLVYLISAIRVIPLDNLVQTVIAVIKNPPPTEGLSADVCLDVSVLELFYCYMRNASATQLSEAWSSLLTLVREGSALSPPSQFLLAALLHELMIKCCPLEERKDQKDLQDVTAKLIESVSQVCGSCLEQTTWLRRNLAVKEQQDDDSVSMVSTITSINSEIFVGVNNNCSVQAQLVLSEILAPILDICFGSSEKDKVITILTSLMYNIVPYLKTHTNRNMASFSACSKLLSSLSSYQYTRKAWRKDVFDLLLDNALFQMDYSCLKYWKVIIDNLMTHDNTTFKDLMIRVTMTQTGGLGLFSSREQEYEQRAQLLKRLAFVIFCSEIDQYAKYMPEIQEQLTTSLRISVPGIQAQVFLCFRVLLLRMSPIQVTSLWPIIISEMLQVFIQIEQELITDSEEFRNNTSAHIKVLSGLDASWATNSNNGLHALGHPHWLRLQLAVCKLLDLALLLPATSLPQFQMYRWAFVCDDLTYHTKPSATLTDPNSTTSPSTFTPHVTRIAQLMDQKYSADTRVPTVDILPTRRNELLLTVSQISALRDLHAFFKTLSLCSNRHRTECGGTGGGGVSECGVLERLVVGKRVAGVLEKLDRVIEMDFLDRIPR